MERENLDLFSPVINGLFTGSYVWLQPSRLFRTIESQESEAWMVSILQVDAHRKSCLGDHS